MAAAAGFLELMKNVPVIHEISIATWRSIYRKVTILEMPLLRVGAVCRGRHAKQFAQANTSTTDSINDCRHAPAEIYGPASGLDERMALAELASRAALPGVVIVIVIFEGLAVPHGHPESSGAVDGSWTPWRSYRTVFHCRVCDRATQAAE